VAEALPLNLLTFRARERRADEGRNHRFRTLSELISLAITWSRSAGCAGTVLLLDLVLRFRLLPRLQLHIVGCVRAAVLWWDRHQEPGVPSEPAIILPHAAP
jgi:hypothetical protein